MTYQDPATRPTPTAPYFSIESENGTRKGRYPTREAAREAIRHMGPQWVWIIERRPADDPALDAIRR